MLVASWMMQSHTFTAEQPLLQLPVSCSRGRPALPHCRPYENNARMRTSSASRCDRLRCHASTAGGNKPVTWTFESELSDEFIGLANALIATVHSEHGPGLAELPVRASPVVSTYSPLLLCMIAFFHKNLSSVT